MLLFVLGIGRVAFLSIGMKDVCLAVVQVLGRLNPFPVRTQRRGASASIRVFSCRFEFGLPPLMPLPRDDQYISLSPTESPVEDADMESGAVALPASQVECQESRKGLTRLPADTPRTPALRVWIFSSSVTDYELIFQVVHGLSQGTLVPDSVILHL